MTHYFATLVRGGTYRYADKAFEIGEEVEVTKEVHDYLSTTHDTDLAAEGNNFRVVKIYRFKCRAEDATVEEKVLEEIQHAPLTLRPPKKI